MASSTAAPPQTTDAAPAADEPQTEGSKLKTFLGILKKCVALDPA